MHRNTDKLKFQNFKVKEIFTRAKRLSFDFCQMEVKRYSTYKTNPFRYSPSGW